MMSETPWKEISDSREKYKAYLCSREWAEKRNAVVSRANGRCERCGVSKVEEVHHKTYARLYDEPLKDLEGLCHDCHKFVGGHSEFDPTQLKTFRTPPQNHDAERALLASMLLMNEAIDDVVSIVSAQSFYGDSNRRIAAAIFDMHRRGMSGIDAVTVVEELNRRNEPNDIDPPFLVALLESPASPSLAIEYAQIVRSKATQRSVIYELSKLVSKAYVADENEVLAEAEKALFALSDQRALTRLSGMDSIVAETMEHLYKCWDDTDKEASGVPSGFDNLDEITTGFRAGELVILAARPSMGKTAFACNIIRSGTSCLVFSLEQSRTELCERLLCIEGRIDSHALRTGTLDEVE